ncbi:MULTISPECIES: lysozyme family protein [Listeria]|uniref:lysozyme family protein n=1 Tax=Listeria TaxID=1637 RepID=UPI000B59020A|nr:MULTISPECIES: lysozyme family protein [Listeria]
MGITFKLKLAGLAGILSLVICLLVVMYQLLVLVAAVVGGAEEEQAMTNLPIGAVSKDVLKYQDDFEEAIRAQHLDAGYLSILLAICMQESGGHGDDVMQASESMGSAPNTISKAQASIQQGVKYFASLVKSAKVKGPGDEARLKVAVQSYNYGGGFIGFVEKSGGQYTPELAKTFSILQAAKLGWTSYGDPLYVEHVWRYVSTSDASEKANVTGQGDFKIPVDHPVITSGFGARWGTVHKGVDFGQPIGTLIGASEAGTVEFAGFGVRGHGFGGYGNCVLVNHHNGYWTLYAHMSQIRTAVGQKVQQGQIIGDVGSTGDSTGPHLHFEIRTQKMGGQVDPVPYLYPQT